ncbi:flagellar hook assembly protein FlgD [Pseudobacteriovorax antillogorgiicola]|uniref:Basal-body rod modification protein FlgD n=1 Tax=Pseudobacteriovorax antillogorgiicola TaxID=1513793 RepID=A0A1Y6CIR7_9BACT|nr:flagellar hook assembly protein FlgD [Pseudobacteriovorax antillogorgiicola]TCS46712.1 flagellar hook assembly protein FlgD [Pseudobacteriovorax antillogorgiicola]SMF66989.1 Flagellar hook assembly protein FlgD [Pseudobacteriovorax antillogorgiicola]
MAEMSGALQNRIAPPVSQYNSQEFSDVKVDKQTEEKRPNPNRTSFKDLISNSMDEVYKERDAKKFGDLSANTEEEFFEKLAEQTKQTREVKKELGKDEFLQLFVAQLQNQDPLNPDDGTEMASKLAQFNGLEQMMNMNKTMDQMVKAQNVGRNLQMVNYVGKEIAIDGGRVKLRDGELSHSDFEINMPVTRASLTVRDSSGMVVMEKELGPIEKGKHKLDWDGKNSAGNTLNDGLYTYAIHAKNMDGEKVPVNISSRTIISGVDVQSDTGALFTELGKVNLEDIKTVGNPGYDRDRPADKARAAMNDKQAIESFEKRKADKVAADDEKKANDSLKNLAAEAIAKTKAQQEAKKSQTENPDAKASLTPANGEKDQKTAAKAGDEASPDSEPKESAKVTS